MPKDSIDKRMRYRTKKENTFAASLGGENKLTNAVVDYKIGYTRTEERVNDEMERASSSTARPSMAPWTSAAACPATASTIRSGWTTATTRSTASCSRPSR
jgi:hypothetical protein